MAISVDAGTARIGLVIETSSVESSLNRLGSKFYEMANKASSDMVTKFKSAFDLVEVGLNKLGSAVNRMALGLVHVFTTALKSLESELTRVQGFMSSMTLSVGTDKASEQYDFLKKTADELGVSLSSLVENYGRLSAAMTSSGASIESVQTLFEGLAKASRSYHLSAQDTHWAMYAFTQIASKAKLSMEELNRQFAEKVPGAIAIFAQALRGPLEKELGKTGATIQELKAKLIDLVKAGKIDPIQFSIAVGPDLIANFTKSAEVAAGSVDSALNRMRNMWTDFAKTVIDSGAAKKMAEMIDTITAKLTDSSVLNSFANLLGETADKFTEKLKNITANDITEGFKTLKSALEGIVTFMAALIDLAKQVLPHLREIAILAGAISGAKLGAQLGKGNIYAVGAGAVAGGATAASIVSPDFRKSASDFVNPTSLPYPLSLGAITLNNTYAYFKSGQTKSGNRLSSGKIGTTSSTKPFDAESEELWLQMKRESAKQEALRKLFLKGEGSGKSGKSELNNLQKFMQGLDYKIEGKEEGLAPQTLESLDKLEKAFKKGVDAKRSYAEYKAFIEENDPNTIKRINEETAALKASSDEAIKQVDVLREQVKYYGMYESQKQAVIVAELEEAEARAMNSLSMDSSNALVKKQLEYLTKEIAARKELSQLSLKVEANQLKDQYKTDNQKYLDRITRIGELRSSGAISQTEHDDWVNVEQEKFDKLAAKADDTAKQISEFMKQAAKNMQDSMADFFFDTLEGKMTSFSDSFGKMVNRMVANAMAARLNEALFGNINSSGKVGGLLGAAATWVKEAFFSAHGNVIESSSLHALSNSVISSPVMFPVSKVHPFAAGGVVGIAGEAGAETILPLLRTASGDLGVRSVGGTPNINITVNNSMADQANVSVQPRMNNGNMDIDVIVQRALAKDLSRNGPFTQGLANTFGLARNV